MSEHVCNHCGRVFTRKFNLTQHINRKKPCTNESRGKDNLIFSGTGFNVDPIVDDIVNAGNHSETESMISDTASISSEEEDELEDEESEENKEVWLGIAEEAKDYNGDMLEAFKAVVLYTRKLRRNPTYEKIMETCRKAKDEDGMSFNEALNYAIEKRKYIILKAVEKAKIKKEEESKNEEREGRGMFLSPHYRQ